MVLRLSSLLLFLHRLQPGSHVGILLPRMVDCQTVPRGPSGRQPRFPSGRANNWLAHDRGFSQQAGVVWNGVAQMADALDSDGRGNTRRYVFVMCRQLVQHGYALLLFLQCRTLHLSADDLVGIAGTGDLDTAQHMKVLRISEAVLERSSCSPFSLMHQQLLVLVIRNS